MAGVAAMIVRVRMRVFVAVGMHMLVLVRMLGAVGMHVIMGMLVLVIVLVLVSVLMIAFHDSFSLLVYRICGSQERAATHRPRRKRALRSGITRPS